MANSKKVFHLYSISEARNVIFGIATLWIGLFHSYLLYQGFPAIKCYTENRFILKANHILCSTGNAGVDMFLFLSGVGLFFSYTKDRHILSFWKKRLTRVLPTAVLIATFYFTIRYVTGRYSSGVLAGFERMTFLYFFIKGERVFWFISLILALYVVFPIFYKIIEKFRLWGMLALVASVIGFAFFLRWFAVNRYMNVEVALWRIPSFIIGIWAGKFVMEKKKISRHWLWLFLAAAVGALFMMLRYKPIVTALVPNYTDKMERLYIWIYRLPGSVLGISLVILLSFVITAIRSRGWCNILRNFFEFVGMYSMEYYMIYLNINNYFVRVFHVPARHAYIMYFGDFVIALALCVIARKVCDHFMTYMQRKPKELDKIQNSRKKKKT